MMHFAQFSVLVEKLVNHYGPIHCDQFLSVSFFRSGT